MSQSRRFLGRHAVALLAVLISPAFAGPPPAEQGPRLRVTLPEHEAHIAEFSPDGRVLVTDGASGGCVRDAATGRVLVGLMRAGPVGPARATQVTWPRFAADGRRVVVQLGGQRFGYEPAVTLAVFDVATGRECASFAGVGSRNGSGSALPPPEYALSADGSTLAFNRATGLESGTVTVWDIASEKVVAESPGAPPLALSADGGVLAHSDANPEVSSLTIRPLRSGLPAATLARKPAPRWQTPMAIALSPDGKLLAAGRPRGWGEIEIFEAGSGRVRAVLQPNPPGHGPFSPMCARFGPGARGLFLEDLGGYSSPQQVQAWDLSGGTPRLALQGPPEGFTPDGSRVVVATYDHTSRWRRPGPNTTTIRVSDLTSSRARFHETGVRVATISPDGRLMALPSDREEPIGPRDLASRVESILYLLGLRRAGIAQIYPPTADVHEIRFRDVATGRLVGRIDRSARPRPPGSVQFSPDGKTLIVKYIPEDYQMNSNNPIIDWSVELWDLPAGWPGRPGGSLPATLATVPLLIVGAWLDRRRTLRGGYPEGHRAVTEPPPQTPTTASAGTG